MHIYPRVWWVRVCSVFFAFGLASAAVVALAPQARAITIVDCAADPAALQPAIDVAPTGDTLEVTGTCVGNFVISRDLTLQGSGTLDGGGTGTVLTVSDGVSGGGPIATVIDLTITNGGGGTLTGLICGGRLTGGGIFNDGDLTLGGAATVTANTAQCAGGIFVDAFSLLTMNGSAAVSHNSPDGIGVDFFADVTLNGSSAVDSNAGEGIVAFARITMNDSSTISNNSEEGILDAESRVVMNDRSSVTGNGNSGIVIVIGRELTMNGHSSISGNTATFGGGINSGKWHHRVERPRFGQRQHRYEGRWWHLQHWPDYLERFGVGEWEHSGNELGGRLRWRNMERIRRHDFEWALVREGERRDRPGSRRRRSLPVRPWRDARTSDHTQRREDQGKQAERPCVRRGLCAV